MIKQKINISESLFYVLGVSTTIQLLSLAGISVFNLFLIVTTIIVFLINNKNLKDNLYFCVSFMACLLTLFFSITNFSLTNGFRNAAIKGGIIYLLALILYLLMDSKPIYAEKLLKGFEVSCKLTLIWCFLQLILFYVLRIDINSLVFGKILGLSNATGDYYNGVLIPSGFYSHRAILMPSLFYLFFSSSNIYICIAIILIGCLTRSTAIILGLLLALMFRIFIFAIKNNSMKISRKKMIALLSIAFIGLFAGIIFKSEIADLVSYIFTRISDATSNKTDNSSVVHFLYYKSFEEICKSLNLPSFFLGTGFGTSGQHYTWFNGQYAWMESWVVESDYINIFLNQGIVGIILWGFLLIKLIMISKKYRYWENIAFILVVACIGILYNIQYTWFIVVEMAMLILSKNRKQIWGNKRTGGKL